MVYTELETGDLFTECTWRTEGWRRGFRRARVEFVLSKRWEEKKKVRKRREKRVKKRRKEVRTWPAKEGLLRLPGWWKDVSFAFFNSEKLIKLCDDWAKIFQLLSWFSLTCWELPVLKFRHINFLQTWDVGVQDVHVCRFRHYCCFTIRLFNLTVFGLDSVHIISAAASKAFFHFG